MKPQELFYILKNALQRKTDVLLPIIESFQNEIRLHHGNKFPTNTAKAFELLEQFKDRCLLKVEQLRKNGTIPQAMFAAMVRFTEIRVLHTHNLSLVDLSAAWTLDGGSPRKDLRALNPKRSSSTRP